MQGADEALIGRKILLRLVVPSALFVLMGAIDRTNVGFAALQMNEALGLSGTQYGFGAGVLFVGYLAAKYPSVLLYEAIGMRRWLGLITVSWGVAACLMGFISNQWELYGLRVFIGFAEGGLSSGLMIYLSNWATERYRASILAIPIMAISIAQVIGAPVSGILLEMDNPLNLEGWRFMFLAEGLPAVLLGIFAWFYYPDSPREAGWLSSTEKAWLTDNVKGAQKPSAGNDLRWGAIKSPIGWTCAAIWFCILASNYGVMFWLPQIVQGMAGLSAEETGLIVALPWAGSALGLYFNAWHSDRTQERYFHVGIPALIGGAGLIAAYFLGPGIPGLAALVLGGACTGCTVAAFWAIPTKLLPPASLAMGIVMINIVGSMAGASIPPLMGYLSESSGSFLPPTLLLCGISTFCFVLCLFARMQHSQLEPAQPAA
ncbi:MFS transporter [Pelagerythrobacter marensis]|uniref:MFS transporter n=1 Tax=Pelagerythrobacter marensis TaxID=543877 RepID=A0ABZ2D5Q1_9SPHN